MGQPHSLLGNIAQYKTGSHAWTCWVARQLSRPRRFYQGLIDSYSERACKCVLFFYPIAVLSLWDRFSPSRNWNGAKLVPSQTGCKCNSNHWGLKLPRALNLARQSKGSLNNPLMMLSSSLSFQIIRQAYQTLMDRNRAQTLISHQNLDKLEFFQQAHGWLQRKGPIVFYLAKCWKSRVWQKNWETWFCPSSKPAAPVTSEGVRPERSKRVDNLWAVTHRHLRCGNA